MEQIIEKRIICGQEFVHDWYVSIDGLGFRWLDDCKNHEEYINKKIEQYEMFLDIGIYTPEQLYEIYTDYESKRTRWRQASLKEWRRYNAGQYALGKVLQNRR